MKKAIIIILIILLLLAAVGYGLFAYSFSRMNRGEADESLNSPLASSDLQADDSTALNLLPAPSPTASGLSTNNNQQQTGASATTNILLIGTDNDNLGGIDKRGNADGLILITINNKTKKIAVTSILREVYIEAEAGKGNEATLVYHYYGLDSLIKGIEDLLQITIDNYMIFNYLDIIDIVDAAGGVDIELYNGEIKMLNDKVSSINYQLLGNSYENATLPDDTDGMTHLNGIQAAGYMRIRLSDQTNNDFGRTQRIRNVIFALKNSVLSMPVTKMYSFGNTALEKVTTDLSQKDVMALMLDAVNYKSYDILSARIPVDGTYVEKNSAQHIDLELNRNYFNELVN